MEDKTMTTISWTQRHPNILLLLVWLGGATFNFSLCIFVAYELPETTAGLIIFVSSLVYLIVLITTNGWVLKQKGRRLAWLWCHFFIGLIPIIIALLPPVKGKEGNDG